MSEDRRIGHCGVWIKVRDGFDADGYRVVIAQLEGKLDETDFGLTEWQNMPRANQPPLAPASEETKACEDCDHRWTPPPVRCPRCSPLAPASGSVLDEIPRGHLIQMLKSAAWYSGGLECYGDRQGYSYSVREETALRDVLYRDEPLYKTAEEAIVAHWQRHYANNPPPHECSTEMEKAKRRVLTTAKLGVHRRSKTMRG
jgi:hypothetical protein